MDIKRFLKTAMIFFSGNMLTKLISFLLIPLYTLKIDPSQFGTYDFMMSLINLIVPLSFFQIWDGMYRYSFDHKSRENKNKVISNSVFICFIGSVIYISVFSIISTVFKIDNYIYVLVYGWLFGINYLYTYTARVFLKNRLFAISGVLSSILTAALNLYFILILHWDITSIYVSSVMGLIFQILLIEFSIGVLREFNLSIIDKNLIKKMLKFSLPLCVATVSYWLLSGYTRLLILNMYGAHENGLYAIANKFSSLIVLLVSVLQFAWNEAAYLMKKNDNKKEKYRIAIDVMTIGVSFGISFFCLFSKLVFHFVIASQYNGAIYIVPTALLGVSFNALAGFLGTFFMAEKSTRFILTSTLSSSLINIVLGYSLTLNFGSQGAAISLAISFFVLMMLRIFRLNKEYNLNLKYMKLLYLLLVILSSVLAFYILNTVFIILFMILLCFLFFLFARNYIELILKKV